MRMGRRLTWDGMSGSSGSKSRGTSSVVGGGKMEPIESGKTSDKGLGLIKNRVPIRTLKFDFWASILLGKGGGVVGTIRGVSTEENISDDGCAERE